MTEQELDASNFAASLEGQCPQISKIVFRQHRAGIHAGFFRHLPKAGRTPWILSECDGVIVITPHDHRRMLPNVPDRCRRIWSVVHEVSKNP
jgi:hypothetical protein